MLVVEQRSIVHPRIPNAHHYQNAEGIWKVKDDPGGSGAAIVKEMLVCERH